MILISEIGRSSDVDTLREVGRAGGGGVCLGDMFDSAFFLWLKFVYAMSWIWHKTKNTCISKKPCQESDWQRC